MSDVSGIPNMGFGGGNFFAPQFSYNPQMSAGQASAAYMPAEYYAQNVTNNLYGGGANEGFGRQTDYYSALGASYSRASGSSNPYGVFGPVGGGGGGGEASPYYTTPNVFETGASPFQGGGGSSGMGGSIYNSGGGGFSGGSYGGYGGDSFGSTQNPYPNMSMPGGLNSPMSNSQTQALDWGGLFGGAGARADPAPGMSMPGGLGSPMSTPQQSGIDWNNFQSPANNYNTFQAGVSGGDPYPGMAMPGGLGAPMTASDRPDFNTLFADRAGGLGASGMADFQSPANDYNTFQQPGTPSAEAGTRTYDFKPMFEGGGGGFGSGGTESQTYGSNAGSLGGDPFSYIQSGEAPVQAQGTASGDKSAATIAEEARARLAGLIGSPETAKTVEAAKEPDAAAIPLPRERPAEAPAAEPTTDRLGNPLYPETNVPRPPADVFPAAKLAPNGQEPEAFIVHHTSGRNDPASIVADWRNNRPGVGTQYILDRNGVIHDVAAEFNYTGTGQALPSATGSIPGSQGLKNANLVGMEIIALNDKDVTPAQIAALKQFAAERYPNTPFYGHGEISTNKEDTEGQTGAREILQSRTPGFNFDWSNAPIPDPAMRVIDPVTGAMGPATYTSATVPLPQARPESADAPRPPADISSGTPFVNDGTPFGPPVPPDYKPPAAAPVKHSGLELARANIDTPIEKIAMERGGQKAVDQISSMAIGMTPRQLLQSYGGMFMSRAEPLFQSLGITRQDFDKAISMPQTKQDLKMRFGELGGFEGGGFGPYPAYTGPEEAPGSQKFNYEANVWEKAPDTLADFRRSDNIEDRRGLPAEPPGMLDPVTDLIGRYWDYYGPQADPGKMGQEAGTGQLDQMLRGEPPSAAENDIFNGGFNDIDAAASEPSVRDFQSPANDYSAFQQQPFIPPWQASIPSNVNSPELREAIQQTAQQHDIKPEAVAGVVNTENPKWDPRLRDPDSSYVGLTQMGEGTWRSPGMPGTTWPEYSQTMTGPEQIQAYSQWLDSYGALERARAAGIDVSALPPEAQAALLQGFQFSPNAGSGLKGSRDWLTPYAQGDASMATTLKEQAPFLNEHPDASPRELPTMGSMTDYYRRLMADQIAGVERRWPQQQLFNEYYPTQLPFAGGR